jgi:hypothetical protein
MTEMEFIATKEKAHAFSMRRDSLATLPTKATMPKRWH